MQNNSTPDQPAGTSAKTRKSRRWKWLMGSLLLFALGLGLPLLPLACTTTIIPPAEVDEPTTVLVMDYGHTGSLILPAGDGQIIGYAYGDWNYYALGRRGFTDTVAAMLWPTQGTLARWPMEGPLGPDQVRRQVEFEIEHLHAVRVDEQDVSRLRNRLEQIHEQNRAGPVAEWGQGLTFVHHPQRYTYFRNSNHIVADWLRELRCEIRGPAFYSRWRVEQPEGR